MEHAERAPERVLLRQTSSKRVRSLYVSNLPFSIAAVQLEEAFAAQGIDLEHAELLKKGTGASAKTCGLGVVTLKEGECLDACIEKMDGLQFMSRAMIVRKDKFVDDDPDYHHVPAAKKKETIPAQAAH
mmetsp:Transcript_8438/g.14466  ORF Transcript_8438/g.14466 Transcript_8438/m.14466 type:complete len:129 (+) Transcript_8438:197-583(+)|eukprot:CAMPEP_0119105580 /NCGR_PEP_ID=MMETSP1180-20130426/3499_1 /TAXON_ID=3052 ORGANISM="Chlamydomonas cf sp, Strain CCMP681" /NCGR_SAMPLE_ID=MMETSP1180 /ASSEMBLY_ACC=CAM_ASM_000741 /LENGTH=128 /DNA_ID=CAMNT_0007090661 /DNA_START=197 /DNA_END=583 /DNA_ORIENTATION=-